jgi:hypothetical protein
VAVVKLWKVVTSWYHPGERQLSALSLAIPMVLRDSEVSLFELFRRCRGVQRLGCGRLCLSARLIVSTYNIGIGKQVAYGTVVL